MRQKRHSVGIEVLPIDPECPLGESLGLESDTVVKCSCIQVVGSYSEFNPCDAFGKCPSNRKLDQLSSYSLTTHFRNKTNAKNSNVLPRLPTYRKHVTPSHDISLNQRDVKHAISLHHLSIVFANKIDSWRFRER